MCNISSAPHFLVSDMSDSDVQQWCHTMMILTLGIRDHSQHLKILIVKIELGNGSFHTRSCSRSTSRGSRGRREARWTSRFTATGRLPSRSCTSPPPPDVDYSGGNKTVVVISLPVFKPAIAFQTRSYRLGSCFRIRTAFTYRSPRAASAYSVYSVWRKINLIIISLHYRRHVQSLLQLWYARLDVLRPGTIKYKQ